MRDDRGAPSAPRASTGLAHPRFAPVRNQLDAFLAADAGYSAQLTVRVAGEIVVDLAGGGHLEADSLTGVFSVTKGAAALVIGILIGDGRLDPDARVVDYWPEFGVHGKDRLLVRELLAHRAGLLGVDGGLPLAELLDSRTAAARLAAQRPLWRPGSAFGYHGITIGVLMEELVRRVAGRSLQDLYETAIRSSRDIDFYLGLPAGLEHRYRDVLPMPRDAEQISAVPAAADGVVPFMLNAVDQDDPMISLDPNRRDVRAAGPAAFGGVASARGISALYAAAQGHLGRPLFERDVLAVLSEEQSWGLDRCFGGPAAFGLVFMRPVGPSAFGSYLAFGHDGAGGALGLADPLHDMSFGYVPAPISYPGGVDPRALELSRIARLCAVGAA